MYKCDICGRIISDEVFLEEQENGSGGHCYCEYSAIDPGTGDVWYPRVLHVMREVEWWEMLDWNEMKNAWILLSDDIKDKIRDAGLAPK